MADIITAPINYSVIANGGFVSGGSVVFGEPNVKPDAANPATLKAIFIDEALTTEAQNPQPLDSSAVFDQTTNGVLYGVDNDQYSIVIFDRNGSEISYTPVYDLSDANAAITAQQAAADALSSEAAAAQSALDAQDSAQSASDTLDEFVDQYWGAYASEPALSPIGNPATDGDLYFNTTTSVLNIFNGLNWQPSASAVNGLRDERDYTGPQGETVFSATYNIGFIDVFLNGVKLVQGVDYTALTGTDITLATGLEQATDTINIVAYNYVEFSNGGSIEVVAEGTTQPRNLSEWTSLETLTYDSVADAKADAKLEVGQSVKTLGYTTPNDGGSAEYIVVAGGTGTDDGGSYHDMANGNQLELITDGIVSAKQFGAINGTGSDNSSEIQAAIDFAGTLELSNDEYRCDSALTYPVGQHKVIQNGKLNFSSLSSATSLISVDGVGYTDQTNLASNAIYPNTTVTVVDGSAYTANDIIQIKSTGQWSVNTTQSEFAVIDSVVGNVITVQGSVLGDYKTSDGAFVRKLDTTTGVVFKDFELEGSPGFSQIGIDFDRCAYSGYENLKVSNCISRSLRFTNSVFFNGTGTALFENSDLEGLGYGISSGGSQWVQIGDVTGVNCRHVTTTGDSTGSEALGRYQSYGNIIGIGSRDAIVDTHDGACDFYYTSITGSCKFGNGSDDAVTMEGARISIGSINVSNVERYGLNVNYQGMGDTGRLSFLTIGSAVIEGKAGGDYAALLENSASATQSRLDSFTIGSLTSSSERGVFLAANEGDIGYVDIGLNIVAETDNSVEIRSSANGRIETVNLSGAIVHNSTSNSHYPIFAIGSSWSAVNGGVYATDVYCNGLTATATQPITNGIRSDDCETALSNAKILGSFSNGIVRAGGVGKVKFNDSQSGRLSFSYNPPSIANGGSEVTTVSVPDLEFGDHVSASWDEDPLGIEVFGFVSAANTVTVRFSNNTGAAVDLSSGNIFIAVNKAKF